MLDPVGELRLAKQRIYELEKSEALQRDEVWIMYSVMLSDPFRAGVI